MTLINVLPTHSSSWQFTRFCTESRVRLWATYTEKHTLGGPGDKARLQAQKMISPIHSVKVKVHYRRTVFNCMVY